MTQGKWSTFKTKTFKVTLPAKGAEVTLKQVDMISYLLSGESQLPDAVFAMFASATQEGVTDGEVMSDIMSDKKSAQGLLDFLNMLAKAAFVEPRLVDTEEEADYETTVPVNQVTMTDKMFVMGKFMGMMNQISDSQTFRTETNGDAQPTSEGD